MKLTKLMSCPIIEIYCYKCGSKIKHMINIKPVKDILRNTMNRCITCGIELNPSDFIIDLKKH